MSEATPTPNSLGPDSLGDAPAFDAAGMRDGILSAIDAIRPALQADGGDIVFHDVDAAGVVHVELVGACGSCPVSTMTLKAGVERIIMDRVPGVTAVEDIGAVA